MLCQVSFAILISSLYIITEDALLVQSFTASVFCKRSLLRNSVREYVSGVLDVICMNLFTGDALSSNRINRILTYEEYTTCKKIELFQTFVAT